MTTARPTRPGNVSDRSASRTVRQVGIAAASLWAIGGDHLCLDSHLVKTLVHDEWAKEEQQSETTATPMRKETYRNIAGRIGASG